MGTRPRPRRAGAASSGAVEAVAGHDALLSGAGVAHLTQRRHRASAPSRRRPTTSMSTSTSTPGSTTTSISPTSIALDRDGHVAADGWGRDRKACLGELHRARPPRVPVDGCFAWSSQGPANQAAGSAGSENAPIADGSRRVLALGSSPLPTATFRSLRTRPTADPAQMGCPHRPSQRIERHSLDPLPRWPRRQHQRIRALDAMMQSCGPQ